MDVTTLAFSGSLILLAVVLAIGHIRAWRRVRATPAGHDNTERAYARRKFRRRMQVSGMLAATGVAILVGPLLPPRPLLWFVYWTVVMIVVVWVAVLAAADMVDSRTHYGQLRHEQLVMRAQLEAELRRHRSQEGNGKAEKRSAT